jgi:NTP pyrophosphatase (non-canonical NTP hydrolase)
VNNTELETDHLRRLTAVVPAKGLYDAVELPKIYISIDGNSHLELFPEEERKTPNTKGEVFVVYGNSTIGKRYTVWWKPRITRSDYERPGVDLILSWPDGMLKDPAPLPLKEGPLTFDRVTTINTHRSARWHEQASEPWNGADWGNALAGEVGEACNVIKKLRRLDTNTANKKAKTRADYLADLAYELADAYLYLDLVADYYGINLPKAIVEKFNMVSEREGFSEKL